MEDSDSDDIFLDVVKKLHVYNTSYTQPVNTSRSLPVKTSRSRAYNNEPVKREMSLPKIPQNFTVSGTKVVPASLAHIQPTKFDDYKTKEKDYKTLPVYNRSASKSSYAFRKPEGLIDRYTPKVTRKFIETQKKEYEQLEKENENYRASGAIPQWATVGICVTTNNYGGKKKVQVRSKYAKVMAL